MPLHTNTYLALPNWLSRIARRILERLSYIYSDDLLPDSMVVRTKLGALSSVFRLSHSHLPPHSNAYCRWRSLLPDHLHT